jgi:hypothetical protein
MRTLEKPDNSILTGMQIYHNYIRPHEALNGKTPAEIAAKETPSIKYVMHTIAFLEFLISRTRDYCSESLVLSLGRFFVDLTILRYPKD